MNGEIRKALALWGLETAKVDFWAGRENLVYRVSHGAGLSALRLKRPGYRNKAELISELQWLDAMDHAGLQVPRPLKSLSGNLLEQVGGQFADVIVWMDGTPMGDALAAATPQDKAAAFRRLGQVLAKLHCASDEWHPPPGFTRCAWSIDGLLGDSPVWGRFWENPTLDAETRAFLLRFRDHARNDLQRNAARLDYGLIHADALRENVLIDGAAIKLLDFDDGGFGFRLFDLATTLIGNLNDPAYPAIRAALIEGYHKVRPLDAETLDLFLAIRAVTYIGWIVPRMTEDGAQERNTRFIHRARTLCAAYLDKAH